MMGTGNTAKQVGTAAGSFLGPVGSVLGNVIGGLFGRSGQNSANEANLAIARENREWQERMSNTAYQRSAKDLEKAGLNRILALGSPASTPAGNIATMQNKNAKLAEGITSGISAGLAAKRLQAEIKNIDARTNLINAQRGVIGPASEIGEGAETIIEEGKRRLSPTNVDYDNLWNDFKSRAINAKDYITGVANSVGLGGETARDRLVKIVDEMDTPKGMSRRQKLQWAKQNPEKIDAYLRRQKQ